MNQVIQDNKTLYHIQSVSDYSQDPMDYFVWADHSPTAEDIEKVVTDDFDDPDSTEWVKEIVESANVYSIYTSEV